MRWFYLKYELNFTFKSFSLLYFRLKKSLNEQKRRTMTIDSGRPIQFPKFSQHICSKFKGIFGTKSNCKNCNLHPDTKARVFWSFQSRIALSPFSKICIRLFVKLLVRSIFKANIVPAARWKAKLQLFDYFHYCYYFYSCMKFHGRKRKHFRKCDSFFFFFCLNDYNFNKKTSIRSTTLHVLFSSWRLNNMNISRNSYFSYPTMNCNHKCKVVDEKQKIISWEVEYVFFVKLHEISFTVWFPKFKHLLYLKLH